MDKMDRTDEQLLETIADLHGIPEGSFNIRKNGKLLARNSGTDVEIVSKTDKDGIDIIVKPGVKNKSVHIPVLLTVGDFQDTVYNDFFIGEDSDVTIVAGCGIHNDTCGNAEHDGVHTFYVGKNAKVRYVERHYADGSGTGKKVFDPVTKIYLKENAQFILESTQLGGVTYTERKTYATVGKNAQLLVKEKILTDGEEKAITDFKVKLSGKNSRADIVSRSVAKGNSLQQFKSDMVGKNECFGHVECDGIVLDGARIISTPKIDAVSPEASLVHEAAVGKIAGEQLLKLMSLGLSEQEAEDAVIKGFLN
ncbi:MAG TPA: SufD family Fe-S cluster assembly protein [Candidatus Borkfalkia excrementipullorum]|nr:SufD family Fe-S cluster assembly protein [Candidatus Borkfalkia excrementipullorum]